MRIVFLIGIIFLMQEGRAQEDRKTKWFEHLDKIIEAIDEGKKEKSCAQVQKAAKLYPAHLRFIINHLDVFDKRTAKLRDEATDHLLKLRRLSSSCDANKIRSELRWINLQLKYHQWLVYRMDTDYENNLSLEIQAD